MSFRSHRLFRDHRRHLHLHGLLGHHPGSRRHLHRHPGRVYDFDLGSRHHLRGVGCHRHTSCFTIDGRPTAAIAIRLSGADCDPGIHHHHYHHRSEATAAGVVAGVGARAAAAVVVDRRLDNLGWAGRQTGSAAGVG